MAMLGHSPAPVLQAPVLQASLNLQGECVVHRLWAESVNHPQNTARPESRPSELAILFSLVRADGTPIRPR
ncbi:hypothetical protein Sme01_59900 [Sphaerisporangium melleum]|uniref:Uncharacterized protein n=1 Tax=Sphaerisporangium melleum TaxID=321316 RepID=A0A917VNH3_9ACTN|nr:hypothetical protein GCM10007964_46090 [Sphaerisporangium melleum]GII73514.1 hypothetical protein Sme01_59900 [Sphaerisporangium melleum]